MDRISTAWAEWHSEYVAYRAMIEARNEIINNLLNADDSVKASGKRLDGYFMAWSKAVTDSLDVK